MNIYISNLFQSGIFMCLIVFYFLLGCVNHREDTVFLIPEGYRGTVMIVLDQPDGQKQEYEDGKRVYRIGKNGVLITRFPKNLSFQMPEYYYIDSLGTRKPLRYIEGEEWKQVDKASAEIVCSMGRLGGVLVAGKEVDFESFVVLPVNNQRLLYGQDDFEDEVLKELKKKR